MQSTVCHPFVQFIYDTKKLLTTRHGLSNFKVKEIPYALLATFSIKCMFISSVFLCLPLQLTC